MTVADAPGPQAAEDQPGWCGWSAPRDGEPAVQAARAPTRLPAGYVYPDLSMFVRVSDWQAFARTYPVACSKATEGASYVDPTWQAFLTGCRHHGIIPVGYHFLRAESDVAAQARHFLGRLDRGPCGIMLDVETSAAGTNPTAEQADRWLDAVSGLTGRPRSQILCYLPRWWWNEHGGGSTALADTLLVQSDYRSTPSTLPFAGFPRVGVIQFGSTIPIAGATKAGDMNVAVGLDAAGFAAAIGCAPPPTPEEAPVPLDGDDIQRIWAYPAPVDNQPSVWSMLGHIYGLHPRVDEVLRVLRRLEQGMSAASPAAREAMARPPEPLAWQQVLDAVRSQGDPVELAQVIVTAGRALRALELTRQEADRQLPTGSQ